MILFTPLATAVAVGAVLAACVVQRTQAWFRLRRFQGPWLSAFSHLPHSWAMLSDDCHRWYADINDKYGPIARVAPGILVTSSPEVWARVNKHPGYKRSDWYYHATRIEYRRDNVFTTTDNAKHDSRRKQMAPGYSGRENLELEASIDERVHELIDLIRSRYISTNEGIVPMDLAKKIQYFTLDVISGVGLGKTFGMLKQDADVDDYLISIEQGLRTAAVALSVGMSWIAQAPVVGSFIAPSASDNSGFGKMMATCFRFVDERVAKATDDRSDMLASFVRHGLSGDELRSEALEQIIAGSDTTAGAIRGVLLQLMTNPRVYVKLQEEIDAAISSGTAPPSPGLVSFAEARKLPYLQAVIRESLRFRPPVVNIFSRDVPAGGDTVVIDGESIFLPGGACIGYSAYAMHRSEATYGPDAGAFRPERWLPSEAKASTADAEAEERLEAMVRTNDLVFGHGRWMCLGKPVAQIELYKAVFELLRNFDIAPMDGARPWKARNYLGLFVISDMWVQVTERGAEAAAA